MKNDQNHKDIMRKTMGGDPSSVVRHFNCQEGICQTFSIDLQNHKVWITVVVMGIAVNRVGMSLREFRDIFDFYLEVMTPKVIEAS